MCIRDRHDVVMRSLLMSGADKTTFVYQRQTANNLDLHFGAGQASYPASHAILQAGQNPIQTVTANTLLGIPTADSKGWSYDSVPAGGQSAVLFHSDNAING